MTTPQLSDSDEKCFRLDFLGIGAQKAATTWLAYTLTDHPDIHVPKEKELHFWDLHYDRGIEAYKAFFQASPTSPIRQGEFTPSYAILPKERIQEAYDLSPKVRLIYSVRNPIARAWSAALMAIQDAGMEFEEASDQWLIDHFKSKGSRNRGHYRQCMENWLDVFPSEQCLVLCFEELPANPKQALIDCCHHIDANPLDLDSLDPKRLTERVFAGPKHEIRPSLLPVLEGIYRTEMEQFPTYLDSVEKPEVAAQVRQHWSS
ncbi:sulfotransferase domain-containing protein [Verrucomicrobia bacterium]|nr:sulfotransferase domain-containing protein [Verrucomicrobiota bacterium]